MISTERMSNDASLLLNSCGFNRAGAVRSGGVRPHGRVDYHLLYIVKGFCRVVLPEGEVEAGEGSLVLYRPGERMEYYFEANSGSVSYYIHFTGRDAEKVLRELFIYEKSIYQTQKSPELARIFSQMHREYSLSQVAHEQVTAGLLLAFLGVAARGVLLAEHSVDEKKQSQVQAAVERMYLDMDKELSIEMLSRECNLSLGYFSHLFRSVMGVSPHEYLSRLRIERSKEMLLNTDLPILQVGLSVGCADQNYFSRFFKEKTGLSPSAFRAAGKGGK